MGLLVKSGLLSFAGTIPIAFILFGCPTVYSPPSLSYDLKGVQNGKIHIDTNDTRDEHISAMYLLNTNAVDAWTIYDTGKPVINSSSGFYVDDVKFVLELTASEQVTDGSTDKLCKLLIGPRSRWVETDALPARLIEMYENRHLLVVVEITNREETLRRYKLAIPDDYKSRNH